MKKVLVLEDESSIRSFIVINLRRAGYEVVEAESGEEALEKLKQSTRRYAKRQLTWFGTDQRMRWIEPDTLAAGETPLDKAMEILEKEGMA